MVLVIVGSSMYTVPYLVLDDLIRQPTRLGYFMYFLDVSIYCKFI